MQKKSNWAHLTYTASVYAIGLFIFTIFRIILLLTELDRVGDVPVAERVSVFTDAFIMGLRFDIVVSGYIMILPFLVMAVVSFFKQPKVAYYKAITFLVFILYAVAFLFSAVDIPYFNQFFSRLSVAALQWDQTPGFVAKMILQEYRYWWILVPYAFIIVAFFFMLRTVARKIFRPLHNHRSATSMSFYIKQAVFSLLFILVIFVGIRGRVASKSPIRVGTAYFSNYAFPNQLALNPTFTFLRSVLDAQKTQKQQVAFMPADSAIANVQKYLSIDQPINSISPIARQVTPDTIAAKKKNVVLVIMESMAAVKMGRYGNTKNLTPYLDGLAKRSYTFDSIYTAGIHTFNGIYSTLFSYPALYTQHSMKGIDMPQYAGIGTTLKNAGYNTVYFTTHDDQFDNVGGFLKNNDYDAVISQQDYPADKVRSTLGVPDDYMFEFSIPHLNKLHEKGEPFLSVFMTASDHGPYVVPEYFKPKQQDVKDQIVEFADWSIAKFMALAEKQPWFENTIFVFVADHGISTKSIYDMPLEYHHSPLMFYAPSMLKPKVFNQIGGQIDAFPTLMGLLQVPYVNNTPGVDLIQHKRPYMYFSADDKYGVINDDYYLVVRQNGGTTLYKYKDRDTNNYAAQQQELVKSMMNYAESNMQTAQYLISNKMTPLANNKEVNTN